MIVKVGGCNGSGKTSMVRAVMKMPTLNFKPTFWKGSSGKVKLYSALTERGTLSKQFDEVVILGDYRNVCGGMDTISDKEVRLGLVKEYATKAHRRTLCIYEGLITGKTFGAMGALSEATHNDNPWVYVFMGATFEQCVERVLQRRAAAGNVNDFDPERTMRPTFKSCLSVKAKVETKGFPVVTMPFTGTPDGLATDLLVTCVGVAANHPKAVNRAR